MSGFSRPGAVDLSAFKSAAPAQGPAVGAAAGSYTVDVTEQTFQTEALDASTRHVVVMSLWTPRAPESERFNATLASVIDSFGGQIVLARVDIDTNPQIAQAVQAQTVPFVVGLIKGQPVPLFQGIVDEAEVRPLLEELVKVAVANGLTGTAQPRGTAPVVTDEPEDEDDPRFAAADDAFAAGDFDGAVGAYEALVAASPGDAEAAERLAGVRLMQRTSDADLSAAREAAAQAPDDIDAQLLVADLDVSGGHVEDAFVRLVDLVRRTAGDERERVRQRLLELFVVVGADDPRVAPARRALASALF